MIPGAEGTMENGTQPASDRSGLPAQVSRLFLSPENLAARWGVSLAAIRKWRQRRKLPPAVLLGDLPRWPVQVIEKWERERTERFKEKAPAGKMALDAFSRGDEP